RPQGPEKAYERQPPDRQAESGEQDVGDPGAGATQQVLRRPARPRGRETGVIGAMGRQRQCDGGPEGEVHEGSEALLPERTLRGRRCIAGGTGKRKGQAQGKRSGKAGGSGIGLTPSYSESSASRLPGSR